MTNTIPPYWIPRYPWPSFQSLWLQQESNKSENIDLWLADHQSRDQNNELWLVDYLIRSVPKTHNFPGAHIKEGDYYSSTGEYKVDKDASKAMHNSLMYKMCYYRWEKKRNGQTE